MRKFSDCVMAGLLLLNGMTAAICAYSAVVQGQIFFFFILDILGVMSLTWFVQEFTDILRKDKQ